MTLDEAQALFWQAITWPTGIEDFWLQATEATRLAFEQTFAGSPEHGARARLQVYAEAYFYHLAEVLRSQFPVTAWIAGEPRFHNVLTDYVLSCPSLAPDIRRYGSRFVSYLAHHTIAEHQPGIDQVAAIEWAIVACLDARNQPILRPRALAETPIVDWPALRFTPAEATWLGESVLPFAELARGQRTNVTSPAAPIPRLAEPEYVLVFRKGLDVRHRSLSALEARPLRVAFVGGSLAEICEAAAQETEDPALSAQVARWLEQWVEDELFADLGDGAGREALTDPRPTP